MTRINVYSQELTKEVEIVSKVADGIGHEKIEYFGIRMYLASPDILHHTPEDDDRSAITFWVPHAQSFTPFDLASVFGAMSALAEDVGFRTEHNHLHEHPNESHEHPHLPGHHSDPSA